MANQSMEISTREELDLLNLTTTDNGINGKPIIKIIDGWEVYYGANGRRTARLTITYPILFNEYVDIMEGTNSSSQDKTQVIRTKPFEEKLPTGVFTTLPESITCSWRINENNNINILVNDCPYSFANNDTTGQHIGIIILINNPGYPESFIVEWTASGY